MESLSKLVRAIRAFALQQAKWDELRKFGNSRLVQLTILIPIIGYMILFNEKILQYLEISSPYFQDVFFSGNVGGSGSLSIALAYRLYCFYFGFSFLAVGYVLYQLGCPDLVKEYGSAAAFHRAEGATIDQTRWNKFAVPLLASFETRCAKLRLTVGQVWGVEDRPRNDEEGGKLFSRIKEDMENYLQNHYGSNEIRKASLMREHFLELTLQRPIARGVCFSCYMAGIAFLAVPTVLSFLSVVATIIRKI